uniref:Uncharacterized protein n=1 Tax=Anguilla anguilla TaxID=7936 RepID=A0A0E9VWL3_ANGAN
MYLDSDTVLVVLVSVLQHAGNIIKQ